MSQVILRDEEIKSLKTKNQRLAEIIKKKEEEKRLFESNNKELLDINDKLAEKLSGQFPLQGASHLLWDMIITEATKLIPYLNYIKDREMEIKSTKTNLYSCRRYFE